MADSYIIKQMDDTMAKVYGRDLSISTKYSVEVCNALRGKPIGRAKRLLENVIEKKEPIRIGRFNRDTAHKRGIGPGKYPVNVATEILNLLKSAESNAQNKGLSTKDLVVMHISAHKASSPWHFGRQRRRKMKRTHVQLVLQERKQKEPKDTNAAKKEESQKESKK
ncbi:50S ribosomal protein L22 [Candidatus Woesearchaeota archaeon]|nr:50S ribosomal protein L22 [Candidatus Woesearchaeota archaeon]